MMKYKKVTGELPEINQEVWTYNGETEFKNIYLGDGQWKYQLKYPITHWVEKVPLPTRDEVGVVFEELKLHTVGAS